jgi:hypothetical protein
MSLWYVRLKYDLPFMLFFLKGAFEVRIGHQFHCRERCLWSTSDHSCCSLLWNLRCIWSTSDHSCHWQTVVSVWASSIKIQITKYAGLVQIEHHFIECSLFSSWYRWNITPLEIKQWETCFKTLLLWNHLNNWNQAAQEWSLEGPLWSQTFEGCSFDGPLQI